MLWARCCATLIVPHPQDLVVRWCKCQKSACWWENGASGRFAAYSTLGPSDIEGLGLHNDILRHALYDRSGNLKGASCLTEAEIKEFLANTPDSYLFKRINSLIIKFRLGYTSDTRFVDQIADVPKMEEKAEVVERAR